MQKYLKPLEVCDERRAFFVFDIESNNWTDFEMLGFYDGVTFQIFDSIDAFLLYIIRDRYKAHWIYAHNGGRFDFNFIVEGLSRLKKEYSLIEAGSSVIGIKVKLNAWNNIYFADSFRILPDSLERIAKRFATTQKMTGAIDFSRERVSRSNPLHCEYLKNDCVSLYESLTTFYSDDKISRVKRSPTLASAAMKVWRQTLKTPIRVTNQGVQNFVRQGYVGGRCEIFKMSGHNLNSFDVNSLYPTMMRDKPMPREHIGSTNDAFDFGFHDVTVFVPETYIPVLPHKFEMIDRDKVIEKKLLFPMGEFRGVFFSEELKLASECGAKILKHHRGELFSEDTTLFKDYIDYFYNLRLSNPGDNAKNYMAKLFMNSLYGKFGQKEERDVLQTIDFSSLPDEYVPFKDDDFFNETKLIKAKKESRSAYQLVHISAAITAWARIHMARNFYLPYDKGMVYTDTDSVFSRDTFKTGSGLGELKLEKEIERGVFLLPKGYYLKLKNGQEEKKLKGFPKKYINALCEKDFLDGRFELSERRFATLRASVIRNRRFVSMITQNKSLRSIYTKRRVLKNLDTEPWNIKNGEILNGAK